MRSGRRLRKQGAVAVAAVVADVAAAQLRQLVGVAAADVAVLLLRGPRLLLQFLLFQQLRLKHPMPMPVLLRPQADVAAADAAVPLRRQALRQVDSAAVVVVAAQPQLQPVLRQPADVALQLQLVPR